MSRNDRSDILVATGFSVTIGLAVALSQSHAIKKIPELIEKQVLIAIENIQNWSNNLFDHSDDTTSQDPETSTNSDPASETDRNYRTPILLVTSCIPPTNNNEPPKNNDEEVAIYQACQAIYKESLSAVKFEKFNTANQASQERLKRVSEQAAKKKQQELRALGIVVSTSTIVLIAEDAVINSAN